MVNNSVPNKSKQPLAYYLFWIVLFALVAVIFWCSYQNIIPYQLVMQRIFRVSNSTVGVFNVFNQRVVLTLSWLVAAFFWAVLQGLQVAYLLLTQSERAMDFMIKRANSHGNYSIHDSDPKLLRTAKHQYNEAPLALLKFLAFSRLVAYGLEIAINFSAYPLWDGGMFGLFRALIDWSRFRLDNAVLLLITLIAVEYAVFAAIMVYRLIEVLKESKAYTPKNKHPF